MLTMYEKLMMLPIFKGVGADDMSAFLEKTHLEFNTWQTGTVIVPKDDECERLYCILSGRIQCVYELSGGKIRLGAEYGPGKVIGLDRLYGLDTRYSHSVRAVDDCGTMCFSKSQYMSLLQSNQICTINYLNILSCRCQRAEHAVRNMLSAGLAGRLAVAVSVLTDRDCLRILVSGIPEDDELQQLIADGVVFPLPSKTIEIPSRQALLDYAENILNPDIRTEGHTDKQ